MASELPPPIDFSNSRVRELFDCLMLITAGNYDLSIPLHSQRDDLAAVSHAINVVVGELRLAKNEAERASMHKSSFLRGISHEIRTPISAILGITEQLRNSETILSERERLHARIDFNSRYLLKLVDALLNYSRADMQSLESRPRKINIERELTEDLNDFAKQALAKGLQFAVRYSPNMPKFMEVDWDNCRQVIRILTSNAINHTEFGKVSLELYQDNMGGVPRALVIDVRDTGCGITEAQRKSIFEPFLQKGSDIAAKNGAVGLGLSIAKRISEFLEGGLILQSSHINQGSNFRFYLPVTWLESDLEHMPTALAKIQASGKRLTERKILVVEDCEDLREFFKDTLLSAGASIDVAKDGQEALDILSDTAYDLVVMDVSMPKLDGIQAAQILRREGFQKPILAVTAYSDKEKLMHCLQSGYSDTISKPFFGASLIEKVSSLLDQSGRKL